MENDRLLRPREAAEMLGVDPKTLTRWANAKKIRFIRTVGGHRRYPLSNIRALLSNN